MQTRRDQVQAYRFAQGRVQAALLSGEPDLAEQPLRRQGVATFAGFMVAVLVVAGFGIYGLIRPGGRQDWRDPRVLVVERETGARFVYDDRDDALHPVVNYASARLILNQPQVTVRQISRTSLAAAPRGATLGRVGLPDSIPAASRLINRPWVVCSGPDVQGRPVQSMTVGTPVAGQQLGRDRGLLVGLPDGRRFLIWNDTKLEILHPQSAMRPLGYEGVTPLMVSTTWVNAVRSGPDLTAPVVVGVGAKASYLVGNTPVVIGQVLRVDSPVGDESAAYVVLDDGLAPVSSTLSGLLYAAYGAKTPPPSSPSRDTVIRARQSVQHLAPAGLPTTIPPLWQPAPSSSATTSSGQVCASYTDPKGETTVAPVSVLDSPAVTGGPAGNPDAARVVVPAGSAALVRSLPHDGQPSQSLYLVTDAGIAFPIPSGEALNALGLAGVTPQPLPTGMLNLIPQGNALDPQLASSPLSVEATAPS